LGPAYQVQGKTQKQFGVLKFLPENLARTRENALRFVHFYRERRKVKAKGIVPVLDLQVEEGIPFVLFPFLGGVTLEALLQAKTHSDQKVTWEEGSEILEGIARILARAHPFFHGNLKPRNIFLQVEGVTLTDDGFLNFLPPEEFLKAQNSLPLSANFMAPELFIDPRPSVSLDLYSFGALAYFIFTGREPVHPLASLESLRPDLPKGLGSLVSRLLSEEPKDRFSSFSELMIEWGRTFSRSDLEEEFTSLYQKQKSPESITAKPPQVSPAEDQKRSVAHLFEEDQVEVAQYQPTPPQPPPPTPAPPLKAPSPLFRKILALSGIILVGLIGFWFYRSQKESPSPPSSSAPQENLQVVRVARETLQHVEELRSQLEKNYAQLPTFAEAVTLTLRARELLLKKNNPARALEMAQQAEKLFLRIASFPPSQPAESVAVKSSESPPKKTALSEGKREEKPALSSPCPKDMVLVREGTYKIGSRADDPLRDPLLDQEERSLHLNAFCIDIYEYPNKLGSNPKSNVGFSEAKGLCEKEGKRLCTEEEWEAACRGTQGRIFPYGKGWDSEICNTETQEGKDRTLAKSGSFKGCVSPVGAYDMSGNLMEWTQTPFEKDNRRVIVKGGSYLRPNYAARCSYRYPAPQDLHDPEFGFRCCADVK
jgi:serine/threonine protein kinase